MRVRIFGNVDGSYPLVKGSIPLILIATSL